MSFLKLSKLVVSFVLSLLLISSYFNFPVQALVTQTNSNSISDYTPNYFYNHETAFIISHALDSEFGGMYVATQKDGTVPNQTIPASVWGYDPNQVSYTDKSHVGQATCIRYLVTEYQRTLVNGIDELNNLLPNNKKLTTPADLLSKAASCADFVSNKMNINSAQNKTAKPNRLYYWGVTSRDGTSSQLDDSANTAGVGVARTESVVPWSISELALALKSANLPYQIYLQDAVNYYNWRTNTATVLPDYTVNQNTEPGAGRDVFYPNLAMNLSQLTGDKRYLNGDGNNTDGTPNGAIPFINAALGTGKEPNLQNPAKNALQDGFYTAGYARGALFTKYQQMGLAKADEIANWWDFGNLPLLGGDHPNYTLKQPTDSYYQDKVGVPFAHVRGRELLAGVQKTAWFNYTNGINPNSFYIRDNSNKAMLNPGNFDAAALNYWNFTNRNLWDDTNGVEAWLEAVGQPYKPCFSGGNDVPIGDWQAPTIGNKTHVLNPDGSATVTISDVTDPQTPYLSWKFAGSGVETVQVSYSTDSGANWTTLNASNIANTNNYTATIPPEPKNTNVLYFAKAKDKYSNWTSFPDSATKADSANGPVNSTPIAVQSWDSTNNSKIDSSRAQSYTIKIDGNNTGGSQNIIVNPVVDIIPASSASPSSQNSSSSSSSLSSSSVPAAFGGPSNSILVNYSQSSSSSSAIPFGIGGAGGLLVRSGGPDFNKYVFGGLLILAIITLVGGSLYVFNNKKIS